MGANISKKAGILKRRSHDLFGVNKDTSTSSDSKVCSVKSQNENQKLGFVENVKMIQYDAHQDIQEAPREDKKLQLKEELCPKFQAKRMKHYEENYIDFVTAKDLAKTTLSGEESMEVNHTNGPDPKGNNEDRKTQQDLAIRELASPVDLDPTGSSSRSSDISFKDISNNCNTSDLFLTKRKQHYNTYMEFDVARVLKDPIPHEEVKEGSETASEPVRRKTSSTTGPSVATRKDSNISFQEMVEKFHVDEEKGTIVIHKEAIRDFDSLDSESSSSFIKKRKEYYDSFMRMSTAAGEGRKLVEEACDETD